MPADDLKDIGNAINGLTYPSESDEAFDLFQWGSAAGNAQAQVLAHARVRQPIAEVHVNDFFAALDGTDDAARFRDLRRALEASLTDLRVFRVGKIRVEIYIVGKTKAGQWAGVHTTSVET